MSEKVRIALVVSHPIQHFCPQYSSFAGNGDVEFKVFFASALGFRKYHDELFQKEISWGNLRLDSFDHEFLNGDSVLSSNRDLDAPSLDTALTKFAPSLLIVYGYYQKVQRRAYRWARKRDVSILYISDSERRQENSVFWDIVKYPFLTWYFYHIDHFLTVGNANEEYYERYRVPKRKFIRMHFPIDIDLYKTAFANKDFLRKSVRKQLGISIEDIVLIVVGKLVPWKSQDHIIDALIKLEGQGLTLQLLMVGSGPRLAELRTKAGQLRSSSVHFVGFIPPEDLPSYYATADIYVHPASVEPHSIAVSEAIYMGLPIIVSDRCGSYGENDDVQEGKNGFVFPWGNIEDLSKKILRLCDDKALMRSFSTASHCFAEQFQEISHKLSLEKVISLYKP